MSITKIGIIGAGQMGSGIAHSCALAGFSVTITDQSEDALLNAQNSISRNLERQLDREKINANQKTKAEGNLHYSEDIAKIGASDFIIEAATENESIKNSIFTNLIPHLAPHTILASNTSSLSITKLAANTDRPDKFIGVHFMNPVPVMPLVELIKGISTSEETYKDALKLVDQLGKTATESEDYPAFIINRVLIPMINEAIFTVMEGVGTIEAVDKSMKLGANHPMGPLELADFIGLDTCLSIMNVLYDGFGDSKYRPCPLLIKYVDAGWLGRKTNKGFYDYSKTTPVPTR